MHHYFLQFPLSVSQAATSPYGILFPIARSPARPAMTTASGYQSVHRYAGAKSPAKQTDETPDHEEDHRKKTESPPYLPQAGNARTAA